MDYAARREREIRVTFEELAGADGKTPGACQAWVLGSDATMPSAADREAQARHAEVEEQRVHNREIKGEVRKKFKAALAVTAARDPIAERAKATAKAAIASVLATYKD